MKRYIAFLMLLLTAAACLPCGVSASAAHPPETPDLSGAAIGEGQRAQLSREIFDLLMDWLAGLRPEAEEKEVPEMPYVYRDCVPILMYHEINDDVRNNLYLSVDDFVSHLDYFEQEGITPITMKQLYDHWVNEKPLPEKPIVLTFDDGYRSMYTTVFPLLRERGWPGTFYCVTDTRWSEGFLSEQMIREMVRGGMEIGSHTAGHVELDVLSSFVREEQLTGSMNVLEEITGQEITQLCYPVGKHNGATRADAESAGYLCAVTTEWGFAREEQGLFALRRLRINTGCTDTALASMLSPLGY